MAKYPQLNIRVDDEMLSMIDDFRRTQQDIPNRPEAARRLIRDGSRRASDMRVILILSQAMQKICRLEKESEIIPALTSAIGAVADSKKLIAGLEKAMKDGGKLGACHYLAECIEYLADDI